MRTQDKEEVDPTLSVVYPLGQSVHLVPSVMEKKPMGHGSQSNALEDEVMVL